MKFRLPFASHTHTPSLQKKFRVDARHYWVILLCAFVLLLAAELIVFSILFMRTGARIDAPATPTLETNDIKIKRMQEKLDAIDTAISKRTGSVQAN